MGCAPDRLSPGETALWLAPGEEDRQRLREVIDRLAGRFGAPGFAPHLTLFGGLRLPLVRWEPLLERIAAETLPLTLTVDRLDHGAAFFRCLFLAFADPAPVMPLRRRLAPGLDKAPEEAAEPHVSLLYAELPADLRQDLCRELAPALAGPYRFDALEVVAPRRGDVDDWRDVAGWRLMRRYPLLDAPRR